MVRYYEKLCLLHDVYNLGNKEEPPPLSESPWQSPNIFNKK